MIYHVDSLNESIQTDKSERTEEVFVKVDNDKCIIETIKKAENSKDTIVRVYEPNGKYGQSELIFCKDIQNVQICNLVEREIKNRFY